MFPLPLDAAVSAMTIESGSKKIHASIEKREAAQQRYEDAVRAGVAGALLDQERPDVFTQTENNSGFSHSMFWWYVLPLGFLLTQYTITGYDASAHISEETHGAAESAPKGVCPTRGRWAA